ncbi:MAG: AfsR/SARP family transcriptional regulator [Candidatus Dormibacteraceae bacterium]
MLLVPTDPRGIVLLCGFVAAILFGLLALLTPPGDPIGWAYILLGVVGYFYIQTRIFTTFVWLLVAAGGAAVASAGNPSGWVETGLGLVLAAASVLPVPSAYREQSPKQATALVSPRAETRPTAHSNASVTPQVGAARVVIRTIGGLRIEVGGQDITHRLSEPRLAFLFSYLLARQVWGAEVAAARPGLADEVAPDISAANQRERLRRQLNDLKTADPLFDHLLRINRSSISLDLQGVELDVGRLLEMCRSISPHDLIDTELAEQVRRTLDETKGEFLAGFSELERQVTRGKGMAGEVVSQARLQIAKARADLAFALAQHNLAAGHPARAIPYLRDALSDCQDRQDLARVLVVAYLQTGQTTLATQMRREYGIEER